MLNQGAADLSNFNVAQNICIYLQAIKNGTAATDIEPDEVVTPGKRRWMSANNR